MDKIFTLIDFLNGKVLIEIENEDPYYEELLRRIEDLGVKWIVGASPTGFRPPPYAKYLLISEGTTLFVTQNHDKLYIVRRACEIKDISHPVNIDQFKELI